MAPKESARVTAKKVNNEGWQKKTNGIDAVVWSQPAEPTLHQCNCPAEEITVCMYSYSW